MERWQVKIETKRPTENIDKVEHVEQAFKGLQRRRKGLLRRV
jgi:hypothetical protein